MPGSLRLRLPALFLLGIVIAGVVSAIIAVQLFSAYTRNQSYDELGREARGIARLYGDAALRAAEEGTPAPDFAPEALELATGDLLFYVGAPVFPGEESGLARLPEASVPSEVVAAEEPRQFEFRPPGRARSFIAVSQPLRLEPEGPAIGSIVVAKAQDVVRDAEGDEDRCALLDHLEQPVVLDHDEPVDALAQLGDPTLRLLGPHAPLEPERPRDHADGQRPDLPAELGDDRRAARSCASALAGRDALPFAEIAVGIAQARTHRGAIDRLLEAVVELALGGAAPGLDDDLRGDVAPADEHELGHRGQLARRRKSASSP